MSNVKKWATLIKEFIEDESRYWKFEWINTRAFRIFYEDKEVTFGYGKKYNINLSYWDPEDSEEAFTVQKMTYEYMYGYDTVIDPSEQDVDFIENYKPEGYVMVTEDRKALDVEWELDSIETKAYEMSERVLEEFWNLGGFDFLSEEINRVAKNTACYTYKGKYFYVVPKFDDVFFEYAYFDKNGEIEWDFIESVGIYKVPSEEVEQIISIIADCKRDMEIKSIPDFIYEELKNEHSEESIELIGIDWEVFMDAVESIHRILNEDELKQMKMLDNNWIITRIKDRIITREGDKFINIITGKVIEIKGFTKLLKIMGFESKRTKIPGTDIVTESLEKYGEEYHINWLEFLLDVYDSVLAAFDEEDVNDKVIREYVANKLGDINRKLYRRYLNKQEIEQILEKAKDVCVTLEDSLDGGNCKPGTMAFIKKHNIDTSKVECINGLELYNMADKSEKGYVLNAIKAAISKEKANESN